MKIRKYFKEPLIIIFLIFTVITMIAAGFSITAGLELITGSSPSRVPSYLLTDNEEDEYLLREEATSYQQLLYEELTQVQALYVASPNAQNEELFVSLIAENFIADFYTWENKTGRSDVGGLQFIYPAFRETFYTTAIDEFYTYLDHYEQTNEAFLGLAVSEIMIESAVLKVNELEDYMAQELDENRVWELVVSWEYELNTAIPLETMMNSAIITLAKYDDKWGIILVEEEVMTFE